MNPQTRPHPVSAPPHGPRSHAPARSPRASSPAGPSRGRRALVVGSATTAALAVWLVAGPVLGTDLSAMPAPDATTPLSITASSVLVSSVVAGLLAWALLAALERLTRRGATIWRWTAGAVALLSLAGPLTFAQGAGAAVVLTLLHVAVASILIPALPGTRSDRVPG